MVPWGCDVGSDMGKGKKRGKGAKKDVVCGCKHVTRADVEAAVDAGATDLADVKRMTGAVTKCGKCKGRVKAYLDQALEARAAAGAVAPEPEAASEPETENPLVIHGIYRHFKGDFYLVEDVAHDSETGEEVVVYRKLYGDGSRRQHSAGASSCSTSKAWPEERRGQCDSIRRAGAPGLTARCRRHLAASRVCAGWGVYGTSLCAKAAPYCSMGARISAPQCSCTCPSRLRGSFSTHNNVS